MLPWVLFFVYVLSSLKIEVLLILENDNNDEEYDTVVAVNCFDAIYGFM